MLSCESKNRGVYELGCNISILLSTDGFWYFFKGVPKPVNGFGGVVKGPNPRSFFKEGDLLVFWCL